ncbi:MAG: hypothetical protein C4288_12710 [Leptolyngbya sp. ERB_1_1]
MPKAYSQDLREKAIAAIERGVPKSEVITMFNLSRDSLDRWLKRRLETGSVAATQGYQRGHSHRTQAFGRPLYLCCAAQKTYKICSMSS